MIDNRTKILTRTAVLLALTIVFQTMGRYVPLGPNSNFIVGPLVNACLLVSAVFTGIWGGAIISAAAPIASLLTAPSAMAAFLLPFSPFIAAGNFVLVLFFYLLRKRSLTAGVATGAALKAVFLYSTSRMMLDFVDVPPKLKTTLSFMFSWPQLVTALMGGAVALAVIIALKKYFKNEL